MVYQKIHKFSSTSKVLWHYPFETLDKDTKRYKKITCYDGVKEEKYRWMKYGTSFQHRTDGPSLYVRIISPQTAVCQFLPNVCFAYGQRAYAWVQHGKLHRIDGPAIEVIDENTNEIVYESWYIKNIPIPMFNYLKWADENKISLDNLSEADKILIDMKWGYIHA